MDSGLKALSPHKPAVKSPWGTPALQTTPTCSLATLMDEELARTLQNEEETLSKYVYYQRERERDNSLLLGILNHPLL